MPSLTPFRPGGIYSAQWLPVDAAGRLDCEALAVHVAFETGAGIDGFLGLGSTGEFIHFTVAERLRVLEVLAELAGPLPVIANVTDNRPGAAIEVGRCARTLGLPAIAIMPPMFYPMSREDILEHFLVVADAVGLPVMLYNFPELAGKRIDLETVAAFADRAPLCAVKQSGAEFSYHRDLVALGREKGFAVMSGADTRLAEVFAIGAAGCIGGFVNVVPELMVDIHRACRAGHPELGAVSAGRMRDVGRILDALAFPPNVGAGLAARGFSPGRPKSALSPSSRAASARAASELRALLVDWGLALGPAA